MWKALLLFPAYT